MLLNALWTNKPTRQIYHLDKFATSTNFPPRQIYHLDKYATSTNLPPRPSTLLIHCPILIHSSFCSCLSLVIEYSSFSLFLSLIICDSYSLFKSLLKTCVSFYEIRLAISTTYRDSNHNAHRTLRPSFLRLVCSGSRIGPQMHTDTHLS